jgi:N-acetylglucosamine-6-phosphate deacetylase
LLRGALGLSDTDLFTMASRVPADLLGLQTKGTLEAGADADLAIYDADFACLATFVSGRQVYARR